MFLETIIESWFPMMVDTLIKMIVENDLKLNSNKLKEKIKEIEAYSAFYNENEDTYKEIMRKS